MSRQTSSRNAKRASAAARLPAGNPAESGARITAERVEMSLRTRFDPLPMLSPRLLVRYLQQFEYGYLELAARTWDAMERRDDRLASVAGKAKSALARYGFEVRVLPDLPATLHAEAARHADALNFLYRHCTVTNAVREDESGGFSLLVRQMADAIGKRYSVHEIVWEPVGPGQLTATFRHAPLWFFEAITGRLRYKLQDGAAEGVPMDPDSWLVTVGEGIMEACSVLWVYKHLPLRDWLAYSEKFGMPYLLGKTQAIFNSAEWQAMVSALRGFGNDGAAVVGGADDIVPVAIGKGSEGTPFPGLVERSERAMSILWRGADLGTQAHSGPGQGQGASLQADETSALDEDRAAWLTETLASVSRTAIRYLFGSNVRPLAFVQLRTQVKRDIQLDLAVDAFLLNSGAPVGTADTLARYNRPVPGQGESLLGAAGGAGGSAAGGAGGSASAGGSRGAASEDATLAGIERAANGSDGDAWQRAENFNPNHDRLGRFTTGDGAADPDDGRQPRADVAAPRGREGDAESAEGSSEAPGSGIVPGPAKGLPGARKAVYVHASELLPALRGDDPGAMQKLRERFRDLANGPSVETSPSLLPLQDPRLWITPISDDPNSPWARALPTMSERQMRLIGKDVGDFGKGLLIDGPVDLVKGVASAVYHGTPVVAIADLVHELHTAAMSPHGFLAGYAGIEKEKFEALVAEVKRLTTTPRGNGELVFDLGSLFAGGSLEGEGALAGSKWVERGDTYVLVDANGARLAGELRDGEGSTLEDHLVNLEVRKKYLSALRAIPDQIDPNASLEARGRQAFDLRNQAKLAARAAMTNRQLAAKLDRKEPIMNIQEKLIELFKKGLTGDAAWNSLLESAPRSRKSVNAKLRRRQ